jgi:arsenate reductase-like glutaredoxin family protein
MNETNTNKNLEKILSLSKEELEKIFSQLSMEEIEDLLNKLNEVSKND